MKEILTNCPICKKRLWNRAIKCHIVSKSREELAQIAKNLLDSAKNKPYTFSASVANKQVPHYRYIKKHTILFKKFI